MLRELVLLLSLFPLMSLAQDMTRLERLIAATWAPHQVACQWEPVFGDAAALESWIEVTVASELPESAHDQLTIGLTGRDAAGQPAHLTVKGRARIYGAAWSVNDRVKLGEEIRREDLHEIECEWSALRDVALLDAQTIVGKFAVRPLVPGRAILAADVRPRAIIHSGDPVVIHYEQGGVIVKVEGVAMKDGGVGETIPVRVPEVERNRLQGVIQDDVTLRWIR